MVLCFSACLVTSASVLLIPLEKAYVSILRGLIRWHYLPLGEGLGLLSVWYHSKLNFLQWFKFGAAQTSNVPMATTSQGKVPFSFPPALLCPRWKQLSVGGGWQGLDFSPVWPFVFPFNMKFIYYILHICGPWDLIPTLSPQESIEATAQFHSPNRQMALEQKQFLVLGLLFCVPIYSRFWLGNALLCFGLLMFLIKMKAYFIQYF